MHKNIASLTSSSSMLAVQLCLAVSYTNIPSVALADCNTTGKTTVCSSSSKKYIGSGEGDDYRNVIIESGARLDVFGGNAISLGDNADITLKKNSLVTNQSTSNFGGNYGYGQNTIEFGSNGNLTIEEDARLIQTGSGTNSEPINVIGGGNKITNFGLVESNNNAAIWFQDDRSDGRNIVDNYGVIRRNGGGDVIGSERGEGIDFTNRSGAVVEGDLYFGDGDDRLIFEPGSVVDGDINGGGGSNRLTLQGADGSEDTLVGNLRNFSTLEKTGEGRWTINQPLKNFDQVDVIQGTLALTGNNAGFDGRVYVGQSGVLEGSSSTLPSDSPSHGNIGNIANDGLVRFVQNEDGVYSGMVTKSGAVEKTGTGTLTLNPDENLGNGYYGGTILTQGTLALLNDHGIGAASGSLTFNGGTLRFDREFNLSSEREINITAAGGVIDTNRHITKIEQEIRGEGSLTLDGLGVLRLTGNNSYKGNTNVLGGMLVVDGDQSLATGDTFVGENGYLAGSGTVGGDVYLADGANLSPGHELDQAGTLTINGNLTLSGNSFVTYNLGQSNTVGGPLNDLTNVKGDLVLDGYLLVTETTGGVFDLGTYRLFNYEGKLDDRGLEIGVAPGYKHHVQTSIANQVNIIYSGSSALSFWDVDDGQSQSAVKTRTYGRPGSINGGTGVWQANAAGDLNMNWTDADGRVDAPFYDDAFAVFSSQAGTVTVDGSLGDVRASGMQFSSDGYVIGGDDLTLTGEGTSTIRVGDGTTAGSAYSATIDSVISGDTQLRKSDLGTLKLTANNQYTSGTSIEGGVIEIDRDSNLGAAGTGIALNDGTLRTVSDIQSDRTATLGSLGGTLDVLLGTTLNFTGDIIGSGSLTKIGDGTLTLSSSAGHTGETNVSAGTLSAGHDDVIIASSGLNVEQNGIFALNDHNQTIAKVANVGRISFGNHTATTLTVVGDYVGSNGLIEFNTVLAGDNSPTNRLVVNGNTSGETYISVKNIGGSGEQTDEGIKLIEVAGSSDGIFKLHSDFQYEGRESVVAGAYAYQLHQNGITDTSDGDWYLRSKNMEGKTIYQPGVPSYEAYSSALQKMNTLPTHNQRVGERHWMSNASKEPLSAGASRYFPLEHRGAWARIEGSHSKVGADNTASGSNYRLNQYKAQTG